MSTNTQIRLMTAADYPQVFELWKITEGMALRSFDDSEAGITKFIEKNPDSNFVAIRDGQLVGVILCGMLTAIGGGVIRDVLSGTVPAVLRSDFYATASLLGGGLFLLLYRPGMPFFPRFLLVASLVIGLRVAAIRFRIQLPAAGYLRRRRGRGAVKR